MTGVIILFALASDIHVNSLRPRRNGRYNADDIFKCIFLKENVWIPTKISLKFVPKGPINNIPALVQIMAWRRPGDKPLSEPMLIFVPTHICVTRSQWVKTGFSLDLLAAHQATISRLIARSRGVSKPRDWWFELSHRYEICQAPRQQCCRDACQILERSNNSKYQCRGFETSRDLTIRRLIRYWNGALVYMHFNIGFS